MILYPFHDDVNKLITRLTKDGRAWDSQNTSMLYNSLPDWIVDEDQEKNRKTVLGLTQIIASYFDSLYFQIESLNTIKNVQYQTGSHGKSLPFADRLLEAHGVVVPDLFPDASILERLASRDDKREFTQMLYDTKNTIYKNIYMYI